MYYNTGDFTPFSCVYMPLMAPLLQRDMLAPDKEIY